MELPQQQQQGQHDTLSTSVSVSGSIDDDENRRDNNDGVSAETTTQPILARAAASKRIENVSGRGGANGLTNRENTKRTFPRHRSEGSSTTTTIWTSC